MYASNATNEQDISKHVAVWQKKKKKVFSRCKVNLFLTFMGSSIYDLKGSYFSNRYYSIKLYDII